MKKKVIYLIVVLSYFSLNYSCWAQEEVKTFAKKYSFDDNDKNYALLSSSGKNKYYFLAGGGNDAKLVKVDSIGRMIWFKTYGGVNNDCAYDLKQTNDGNLIMTGYSWSFETENSDFYIVKVDPDGKLLWAKTYGGPEGDEANSIAATNDSGCVICGQTRNIGNVGNSDYDACILKISKNGKLEWQKIYGGARYGNDYCRSIIQTRDGNYVFAGYTEKIANDGNIYNFNGEILLVCLDKNGKEIWHKIFGGAGTDFADNIIELPVGYIIGGFTNSYSNSTDIYLLKCNTLGELIWVKAYGTYLGKAAEKIAITKDQGYIVLAYGSAHGEEFDDDIYLMKINATGDTLWTKSYGNLYSDHGSGILEEIDGFIIAGTTEESFDGNSNMFLLKTDENGRTENCFVGLAINNMIISSELTVITNTALNVDSGLTYRDVTDFTLINSGGREDTICKGPESSIFILNFDFSKKNDAKIFELCDMFGKQVLITDDPKFTKGDLQIAAKGLNLTPGIYTWRCGKNSGKIFVPQK